MLVCDFCGQTAQIIRRIVLDGSYDRLTPKHLEKYACEKCSEDKERQRLGLDYSKRVF